MNPVHARTPSLLRSVFILASHVSLCLPRGLLPSNFQTKILYAFLIYSLRSTCPVYLILLDLMTVRIFCEEKLWSSSLRSFLCPPVTVCSPALCLFSDTLSLCGCLRRRAEGLRRKSESISTAVKLLTNYYCQCI